MYNCQHNRTSIEVTDLGDRTRVMTTCTACGVTVSNRVKPSLTRDVKRSQDEFNRMYAQSQGWKEPA